MAFDQATRNRLQRFVTDTRRILEEEFTRQLQNDYGMDPASGNVTPIENLRHINDQQRETARIMRDTLAHYCASPGTDAQSALDRIVREQAFTVLNRLAALRMAEARGLLIESVGNGYQAKGFQLYARLAGAGLGETGDAYRVYLQSVFDELSQDLPGLFDRYSPQGRLFPREAALMQVLGQINHGEIDPLWAEDETIGWIYQYFNSKEERKAMRDASQAPRNSRELAVRNQFFTPRYVVEFLVDNTLGRLWFNWTGGQTALRDRCQYLLVKPDERPEAAERLRDPRTIKLLDPACGSMHFGLYAFDLFLQIYREAWDWEQAHGLGALDRETGGNLELKPLADTYADRDAFLRDVPRLIIEHNIYGVDIDPRAAQIASLALWLRAQRAWHDAGVKAKDRPQVGQGHVVAAVAPPAEVDLRNQFMEELDPLDAELFEQTLFMLKGLPELGVLLQVEKELPSLIRKVFGEHGGLFRAEDMAQWQRAEERLREALANYAHATQSTYQGRLFAEDALQGLRMIDHCRELFDVIVMNPPFGESSYDQRATIAKNFPRSKYDIGAVFLERGIQMMRKNGQIGILSNRTIYFLSRLSRFREGVLTDARLTSFVDLGSGVLDAMVEAAAATFSTSAAQMEPASFIRVTSHDEKEHAVADAIHGSGRGKFEADPQLFLDGDLNAFSYWLPQGIASARKVGRKLREDGVEVKQGIATGDNFRFLRLFPEVSPEKIYRIWHPYSKGGEYSPFFYDTHLLVSWGNKWQEFFNGNTTVFSCLVTKNAEKYLNRPGLTYPTRTSSKFGPRAMPAGSIFDTKGSAIFIPNCNSIRDSNDELIKLLMVLNTDISQVFMDTFVGAAEDSSRSYGEGIVSGLPLDFRKTCGPLDAGEIKSAILGLASLSQKRETSVYFVAPAVLSGKSLTEAWKELAVERDAAIARMQSEKGKADLAVVSALGISDYDFVKEEISRYGNIEPDIAKLLDLQDWVGAVFSYLVGIVFGRWNYKYSVDDRAWPEIVDPFSPIQVLQPGRAMYDTGERCDVLESDNLADQVSSAISDIWGSRAEVVEQEILSLLGRTRLAEYLRDRFFQSHLSMYSRSRRIAPIYWPISTSSGSYTLWIYYPNLTSQTLYTAINDFVEPKLKQISKDTAILREKGTSRSRDDEKALEALRTFELELIELRDTLLHIAPTYRPNHDDGVQITAAPLWQLFRYKPWQKILKDTWTKLEKGEYDWAHLAMAYWPDRVREKCKTDKSLAIAHDLEALYIEPEPRSPKSGKLKKDAE
ncbi:MAG: BREX-1 system adenine-specific DNA-methyltransferase PglX [Porphyrobacter sp.]|nr:BREX-1 system adenine-specific DNA-methyltransferase PglX [Porphyrobacter sp.]